MKPPRSDGTNEDSEGRSEKTWRENLHTESRRKWRENLHTESPKTRVGKRERCGTGTCQNTKTTRQIHNYWTITLRDRGGLEVGFEVNRRLVERNLEGVREVCVVQVSLRLRRGGERELVEYKKEVSRKKK